MATQNPQHTVQDKTLERSKHLQDHVLFLGRQFFPMKPPAPLLQLGAGHAEANIRRQPGLRRLPPLYGLRRSRCVDVASPRFGLSPAGLLAAVACSGRHTRPPLDVVIGDETVELLILAQVAPSAG